jgi:O-antigen ligase
LLAGSSGLNAEALLPVLPLVGLAVVFVAIQDFEVFVAMALVGRASLDAFKLGTGAVGSGLDVTGAFALVFTGLGALWLVLQPRSGDGPDRSPFSAPIWLLILVGAVGIVAAPSVARSGGELIRLIALGVFLAVLYRFVLDVRRRPLVLAALFASAVIPVMVGLAQVAIDEGVVRSDFVRITGTFQHPNPFSIYLALLLVFGVALIRYVRPAIAVPGGVFLLVIAVALVFTYTRTAWIAVFVGLIVVGLLDSRRLAIGLIVIAAAVALFVPSVSERFDDLDVASTASGQAGNSLAWRIDTWRATLGEIDNPVSGLGLRTADTLTEDGKLPHNDLVRMYVELGLVGLFAYLWLLQRLFVTAGRALRSARGGLSRGIAVGFAGALAAFIVASLVSNVMSQLVLWWYFGTMAVLAAAVPRWESADEESAYETVER